jgi:medium-chain acyl-[acyl-carrier-protein] hydrolase
VTIAATLTPRPAGIEAFITRKWLLRPRPVAEPRLRLLCFPHVGAGASVFNDWADQIPAESELCAVRYPGRENRLDEPPFDDLPSLLERLGAVLAPQLDRPFVLFGHCSGSIVAFELARWLRRRGLAQPDLLVVSSIEAPAVRIVDPPMHLMPTAELFARVAEFGGVAQEILADAEMLEMFEPILRSDYRLVEGAPYAVEPPLDVPITVIGGMRDRFVSFEAMAAWRWEAAERFSLHLLPTDHFVLAEAAGLVGCLLGDLATSTGNS